MWRSKRLFLNNILPIKYEPTYFSQTNMANLLKYIRDGEVELLREELEAREISASRIINGRSQLHYAAEHGQLEVLQYLVENGAEVNFKDEYGITPLLTAIWEGHGACVKYLISKGANPTGVTPDGKTYLEVAEDKEVEDILKQTYKMAVEAKH